MSNWFKVGAVEVPVPPLPTARGCDKVRFVMVVVAKVEVPVTNSGPPTVKAVAEAVCREVWPETVNRLLMVVLPVTARVLEAELKVKLEDVAKVLLPCPNRMSLEVKFWSWIVGVVPLLDCIEPLPETEVT